MNDKDNYFLPFPKRLRSLFDETRVSQQEVADFVGVSRQAVSQWMNGKTIPDCYNFKKVAEFFKVPLEYLYGDTESKVKENLALVESLGLSDKVIEKLQEWAEEKWVNKLRVPLCEVLSNMMGDSCFDRFLECIRKYIAEYLEYRLDKDEQAEDVYDDVDKNISWTDRDADNYARSVGMRVVEAKDLSTFYKYQAMEALELAVSLLPENYYIDYRIMQEERPDKK